MNEDLKNIEAVIFDLDGVVADSEDLHTRARKITCQKYNLACPDHEWQNFGGKTVRDIFEYLIGKYGDKKLSAKRLADHKTKVYLDIATRELKPISGVIDFIKFVREKFSKMGLATSGRKIAQEHAFEKFRLNGYFDAVITRSDFENGKPDPEPYIKTAKKLDLPAEKCLAIEDSFNGVKSAKAAGCVTVGITTSLPKEKLQEAGADHVVDSFKELEEMLER